MFESAARRTHPSGGRELFSPSSKVATIAAVGFLAAVEGCSQVVPNQVDIRVQIPEVERALNAFGQQLVNAADHHDPLGINKQNARIEALEAQLAEAKKSVGPPGADKIVTGRWEFAQSRAAETGMDLTVPHGSSRDSKSIYFKFPQPFHTRPEVNVCVYMLSAASLQIEVKVHTVSKEGFYLQVHPHGGNQWADCWLTWIALPSDAAGHADGLIIP